jgi:hypothetical protein
MKFICLLFFFLFSTNVFAIGKITEVQGSAVEIKRGKNTIKGSAGTTIESNDVVSVGSASKITITFEDSSTAKISENSKLIIDDFVYDPNGRSKSSMRVGLGTVRMASGGIAKQDSKNVNIRTPTAAIAVRGTDFAMTVDELGRSTVVLLPTCKNDQDAQRVELPGNCTCGKIDVATSAGVVSMESPFYATHVSAAQETPTIPVRVDPTIMNVSGEGSLNKPHQVAKVVAEHQEKKESHKDRSKASADEQKAAKDSGKEVDKKKAESENDAIKKASAGELSEIKVATAEETKINPCWPFTSCGTEKGFNWYEHIDPLRGNTIHVSTLETNDNTTYNISVNNVDISQKIVGSGTNHVTIRQWNR